jgi:hypothetical protein
MMIMKRVLVLLGLLATATLLGCGGGSTPSTDQKKDADQAAAQPAEKMLDINTDDPKEVVMGLIEAMKSGDKEAKEALLTTKAKEETAKHGMPVAADAMPNTENQIAEPTYLKNNPNGAHVSCVLSETLADGSKQDYEIVWVLRKEPEIGWRIAGMAVEVTPGTPPQFLNFENPLDMQKKLDEAAAAMAAAMAAENPAEPMEEEGVNQAQATEPATEASKLR